MCLLGKQQKKKQLEKEEQVLAYFSLHFCCSVCTVVLWLPLSWPREALLWLAQSLKVGSCKRWKWRWFDNWFYYVYTVSEGLHTYVYWILLCCVLENVDEDVVEWLWTVDFCRVRVQRCMFGTVMFFFNLTSATEGIYLLCTIGWVKFLKILCLGIVRICWFLGGWAHNNSTVDFLPQKA